jgi:CRP/FNR family transcriptional regulator, cyclic AMP receptor protein
MTSTAASTDRSLRALKNISWLTRRQMQRLAGALTISRLAKGSIIFDEGNSADSAYILLSGIARITCRNRKGERIMVIMVAPGMIPGFPLAVPGIKYNLRCEAVTPCQIGTVDFHKLIEISLGIESNDFKRMADNYLVRWDLVQLRCSNFMGCTLVERLALALLELAENFGIDDPLGLLLTVSTRHKDLAELVGASRPRVTEYLIEFERKRMIVRRDRQLIVKRDRLVSFLAQQHPGA